MRINPEKSKVMMIRGENEVVRGEECGCVEVGGERLEELEEFKYQGMLVVGKWDKKGNKE